MGPFDSRVRDLGNTYLCAADIGTVQVNVGRRCNQACKHCHLDGGPNRTETMAWETMQDILRVLPTLDRPQVDITGGAPELNPHLREFVMALRGQGSPVQVRTNLTALLEPGAAALPEFFRAHGVQLVASLPCYLRDNVDAQRGAGVYDRSIRMLRRLNALGYGVDPALALNLVYNPGDASLPPPQAELETEYRDELRERFGVVFTRLLTLANMPLGRFLENLAPAAGAEYLQLLRQAFNPQTVGGLMCRHQISIGWDGTLYDCDFNLAQGLPVDHGAPSHLRAFEAPRLATRRIVTGEHCFGCTAGHGSSCSGAVA